MKTYRIERCVDDVLNELWRPVANQPPIFAMDALDALRTFEASPHPMANWHKLRAVEHTLTQQIDSYLARAEALIPVPLTAEKRAELWNLFQELVLRVENAERRAEERR
jgi:hypothetical protein